MAHILLDLNVRDPLVSSSTALMLEDTKVVVQSIWRLMTTEEGEIPNFRDYGLNVKQFMHAPLTKSTAAGIASYIEQKINTFEQRAEVVRNILSADIDNGLLRITMYIRVINTGEVASLPTWNIKLNAAAV